MFYIYIKERKKKKDLKKVKGIKCLLYITL